MSNPKCRTSVLSMPIRNGSCSSLFMSETAADGSSAMFCPKEIVFCMTCFASFFGACCLRNNSAIFGFEYCTKLNSGEISMQVPSVVIAALPKRMNSFGMLTWCLMHVWKRWYCSWVMRTFSGATPYHHVMMFATSFLNASTFVSCDGGPNESSVFRIVSVSLLILAM